MMFKVPPGMSFQWMDAAEGERSHRMSETLEKEQERREDEAVLEAVRAGEATAFNRFVDRFGSRIYSFGIRMCGQREDAEDVFQETLLAVFKKIQTLREPGALTTWLYRVVANSCWSRRRKSKFAPDKELSLEELLPMGGVIEDGPVLPEQAGPMESVYRQELVEALEKAVRDLSPEYRVVWLMRDVEGLSTEETAEALNLGISNVKMRLHRARLMLRQQLAGFHPEETAS
jgi:RNA polymerase sigma-70 factor (ECF subfamily)